MSSDQEEAHSLRELEMHGTDPQDGLWGCPIRERWGL